MSIKKLLAILLPVLILSAVLFGCAKQEQTDVNSDVDSDENTKEQSVANNDLFTDEFFSNVVRIRCMGREPVTGEEMEPAISYLKSLKLFPTGDHVITVGEDGEPLFGPGFITFDKSDGSVLTFDTNGVVLTRTVISEKQSYMAEGVDQGQGVNVWLGLEEAFDKGHGINSDT